MTAALDLARSVLDDTANWASKAACIGKAETLEDPQQETEAKALCLGSPLTGQTRCPAINDCHQWVIPLKGVKDPGGVRAGRTEEERNDFRRNRAPGHRYNPADKKECRKCGNTKPAAEFTRHRRHTDGLSTYCKLCDAARQAAHRAAAKEVAA